MAKYWQGVVSCVGALLVVVLTRTGVCAEQYRWSCSPLDNGSYYLPDLPIVDDEDLRSNEVVESAADVVYIFPVPMVNCSGTVLAIRHCYVTNMNLTGIEELVFTLITLEKAGLRLTIDKVISVQSTPSEEICTIEGTSAITQTCCDTFSLIEMDQFSLPSQNFAFGIVRTNSTVDLLAHVEGRFPELLVEHYRPPVVDFPAPVPGNTYTLANESAETDRTLRIVQFIIAENVNTTKAMTSTPQGVSTTPQEVATTPQEVATTPQEAATTADADAAMGVGGVVGGVVGAIVAVAIVVAVVVGVVVILFWKRARIRSVPQEPTKSQQNRESRGYDNAVYDNTSATKKVGDAKSDYSEIKDTSYPHYELAQHNEPLNSYEYVGSTRVQGSNVYDSVRLGTGPSEEIYVEPGRDEETLYKQLHTLLTGSITRDAVRLGDKLGSGQFGTVYRGVWQSPTRGEVEVAVKTLKEGSKEEDRVKFLREGAIMGQFKHANVVEMYGVVTEGEPVLLVLELLKGGDLRQHLLQMRSRDGGGVTVNDHTLLSYCRQVASGMAYLSGKAFVHRDLAARNILVSDDKICKIADFGMSRDLMDESYYVSHGGKIPLKWTSPEALHYKKYSTASDVWSYGALMYEIWSVGHKPFENFTNQKILKLVEAGYRLPPPPGCPRAIYALMISCWHPKTSQRPGFADIGRNLSFPDAELLKWTEEDKSTHQEADKLGANLPCAADLYKDLQILYQQNKSHLKP